MIDFRAKTAESQPIRPHFIIFALLFAGITFSAFPQVAEIVAQLPRDAQTALFNNGSVSASHTDADDIELAPSFPGVDDAIDDLQKMKANIVSERLVLVDGRVSDEGLVRVYNALLGVEDLSYLEYYNPMNDTWHDLFKESYRVNNGDDLDRVPDLEVDSIPDELRIPVLQGLPPFGEVLQTYRYDAVSHGGIDGFRFSSENEWDIRYRRIRVVKDEEMMTYAWVLRGDDYLLMYGIGAAKVFTGFGLFRDRIENSFTSRTDGLFDWLSQNYLDEL